MEVVIAIAIGVLFGSGVWLILRPRSFQVLTGLLLMSYAVNLFIFCMGLLAIDQPPLILEQGTPDPANYTDPRPQASVLTALLVRLATTALYLVPMMGAPGLTGTDHEDGREPQQ